MAERLLITTQRQESLALLQLVGVIDEDSALHEATRDLPGGTLAVIDTAGVTRINSCGVREWVNWLTSLQARDIGIVLLNCSVHIVDQINMVHNFIGTGRIKSFFAPYYCEQCDRELIQHIEVAETTDPQSIRPPCPGCGATTELDHLPEQFFAFLDDRSRILVEPETLLLLGGLGKNLSLRIRELDGGARQAPRVHPEVGPPALAAPPPPRALPPVPLPPPSARRPLALREHTGLGLPGRLEDTEPPQPDLLRPLPGNDTAPLPSLPFPVAPPVTARAPDPGELPGRLPPRPTSEGLSPVATALLVAGIVVVLALMFLLVFRSG
ncbi:MAG: hypothetical protein RBU45_03965 [Myxococcota bacterium]|jgi:anti-anti-sigma regulatory factor|nr:hypothetical protein [Myxococcota bacterium]